MGQTELNILIIVNSGITIIMSLYIFFLYKNSAGVKGTFFWALGALIIGIGLLLKLFNSSNIFISFIVPPLFITIGLYFYLAGILHFKEKKINKWLVFGIPILDISQSIVFYQFIPSHKIRIILHLVILAFYCIIALYEMFKITHQQKYLKKIFLINAFSLAIFLVILLVNVFAVFNNLNFDPFEVNKAVVIMFILSGFIMISLTFGFLSAVNLQLYTELKGQLKSNTKFFAIIAHDLKGPVGTIMNFLNLLNTKKSLKEEQKQQFLEKIELLSVSTFHLLQNLLEWAVKSKNIIRFEKEIIDLDKLIKSSLPFFKSTADFKLISIEYNAESKSFIKGSPKMIETIIRNLISNAIKFTPAQGKITITTTTEKEKIYLQVSDTGIGISAKNIDDLFTFENNKSTPGTAGEVGSGLGLVLCKEFAKKNNGTLYIKSILNKGTDVIIEFPKASN